MDNQDFVEELVRRYQAGERDFSGADLSYSNLSNLYLSEINLSDAQLKK